MKKPPSPFKGRNQSWFHPLRTPSDQGLRPLDPTGGSGQAGALSHAFYRPRCTDRQLLGITIQLSSYYFLRTRQSFAFAGDWDSGWRSLGSRCSLGMTDQVRPRGRRVLPGPCHPTALPHLGIPAAHPNCHPDGARRAIGGISNSEPLPPWWKGSCGILKKSYDVNGLPKPSSWRSVRRGR